MRIGYIVAIIWCLGAYIMYRRYSFVIDRLKEQNKNTKPGLYDAAGLFIFILWPFFMPSIISKVIKKFREKKKNNDGGNLQ